MEWSKGAIFLMATLRPDGLWMAEQTMPYAPSPTTSRTWYCVPAAARPWLLSAGRWLCVRTNIEAHFSRRGLCLRCCVTVLGLCGRGGLGSLLGHGGGTGERGGGREMGNGEQQKTGQER